MHFCARCREPFTPGDEIDPLAFPLPASLAIVKQLAAPHLARLLLFRCSTPDCDGLVTGIYLPPPKLELRGVTDLAGDRRRGVTPTSKGGS